MQSFKQFLSEQQLLEILDSDFKIYHYDSFKNAFNDSNKEKLHPGHTTLMSSEHMHRHNLYVLRLMNKNREVEYHLMNREHPVGELPPEKQNTKALLHALKIIHDDSQSYLDRGKKIKLQAGTEEQHKNYKALAKKMIKNRPNHTVNDIGKTERLDGNGESDTLMIESTGYNAIDWRSSFNKEELDEEFRRMKFMEDN